METHGNTDMDVANLSVLEYTVHGHILGMLDRDQRTTACSTTVRTSTRCASAVPQDNNNTCHCFAQNTSSPSTRQLHTRTLHRHRRLPQHIRKSNQRQQYYSRKNGGDYLRETLRRLKEVLIVGTYLLSIVCIPSSLSAPTSRHNNMEDRMKTHPKWINPCGMSEDAVPHDAPMDLPITVTDLSKQISNQANIALTGAVNFRDEYVQNVFSTEFKSHHDMWKTYRYPWLPSFDQIPKNLGEPTPDDHLDNLKMDEALLDIYGYLQRIAVGLEQMVWDQEDQPSGHFKENFTQSAYNLRSVLCEIQVAIIERNLSMRPDVTRDVMSEEFRKMNNTDRNVRDWFIYRDYMNALEYVVAVFKHFEKPVNAS